VLPVEGAYPAASIVKVVTGAAMLEQRPNPGSWSCRYEGNKYRLSERRLDPPRRGNQASLEDAMATSNNQCFSQWAIHGLGEPRLRRMLERVGWTGRPAVAHAPGRVFPVASRYDLGQLGSGLDGVRVTPLHVAALSSVLADGRLVAPRWIDRVVDDGGRPVALVPDEAPQRVVGAGTASRLRDLMIATTKRGTARRAFRSRRGTPVLGPVEVAGKTGNLNGRDPAGRYEWFFGVAPANDPRIGVVVLQVHGHLWWARSSELAANILREVFCEGSACRAGLASRFTDPPGRGTGAVLASERE
jgi:penicillin-binding protein A